MKKFDPKKELSPFMRDIFCLIEAEEIAGSEIERISFRNSWKCKLIALDDRMNHDVPIKKYDFTVEKAYESMSQESRDKLLDHAIRVIEGR